MVRTQNSNYVVDNSTGQVRSSRYLSIQRDEYDARGSSTGVSPMEAPIAHMISPVRYSLVDEKLYWSGNWLPFNRAKFKEFYTIGPPAYGYDFIRRSKKLTTDEKSELIRFLICLELYEQTPGTKLMTARDVWVGCLSNGPTYPETLKDIFSEGLREGNHDSYNFVFPSRYLIRWEEQVDDLRLCSIPTYGDELLLESFENYCDLILSEVRAKDPEIKLPDDELILFERSTTTSYIPEENRTCPHYEAMYGHQSFSSKELIGLRTVVPVYPGGVRDTIIADIKSNNSIRWIERAFRHILEYVEESAVTLYGTTSNRRIDDVVFTDGYHVLRDIKKCGITYNVQELFPRLKKSLSRHFKDFRWERLDIFSNFKVIDGDYEYMAKRGYGLGMANHVVTFCNIVIFRMCLDSLKGQGIPFKAKGIFGNDDADIVFYGKDQKSAKYAAEQYLEMEHEFHGQLGNMTNTKKSCVTRFGLFYENYSKEGWREKESLVCGALANAYRAPSIRVAKHYIFSQSGRFESEWAREQLKKLAKFWGGEFFKFTDELKIHYEIGGWLNTSTMGLKTTLRDMYYLRERYQDKLINLAISTCRSFVTEPKPVFTEKKLIKNHMFEGMSRKTNPRVQMYFLSENDKFSYYKKLTTFQRNYSSRLNKFSKRVHRRDVERSFESMLKTFLKREPWYAIPDELVYEEEWDREVLVSWESEEARDLDDLTMSLIDFYKNPLAQEVDEPKVNYKWNPPVDIQWSEYELEISRMSILSCSQFSNSGYLPALEYFKTRGFYPLVRWIENVNITTNTIERQKLPRYLSRRKNVVEKKKKRVREVLERPLNIYDSWGEIPEEPPDEHIVLEFYSQYEEEKERRRRAKLLSDQESEQKTQYVMEQLERYMDRDVDIREFFQEERIEEEYVDILEGDDEGGIGIGIDADY